jgi:hypothetical protein
MYGHEEHASAKRLWYPTIVSCKLIDEAGRTCARRQL